MGGSFRGVVDFEFFGVVEGGKAGALLLLKGWYVGELAHVIEHDTEVVVEGWEVLDGFIFVFFLFLKFLLVFGLDSEIVLFGEWVIVWDF